MSSRSKDENYLHFRAPRQHGETFCIPSPRDVSQGISGNLELLGCSETRILDVALPVLRSIARAEIAKCCNIPVDKPWIVSGHQPELFHPGVWLKNFVLDRWAHDNQAVALNLVVNHDVCNNVGLRVPSRHESGALETEVITWDSRAQGVPWERHQVQDRKLFDAFSERISRSIRSIGFAPLVESMWEQAMSLVDSQCAVGNVFAEARHSIEKKHGLQTTEFFSHQLVGTEGFRLLLLHLISQRERFRSIHNAALEHYRTSHHIRSDSHPVPDLRWLGSEIEIPIWVHTTDNPRRRAVFVGKDESTCYLTDQQTILMRWSENENQERTLSSLRKLEEQGIYLRPRALLTTMALRLLFADWFVHGIGGGKYDQLNDRIITAFFEMSPPKFSVISGTLFLPFSATEASAPFHDEFALEQCAHYTLDFQAARAKWLLQRQLERDHCFHPEKYVGRRSDMVEPQLERWKELLKNIPPRGSKRKWHAELVAAREHLSKHVQLERSDYSDQIENTRYEMQQSQLRVSREYSFALYPENWLIPRLRAQAGQCTADSAKTTVHTSS